MFVFSRELRELLKESVNQGNKLMDLIQTPAATPNPLDNQRSAWLKYVEANISDISKKHWHKFQYEAGQLVSKYIMLSESENQDPANYPTTSQNYSYPQAGASTSYGSASYGSTSYAGSNAGYGTGYGQGSSYSGDAEYGQNV